MISTRQPRWTRAICFALLAVAGIVITACGGQPLGLVPTLTPYPTVGDVQYLDLVCPDFIYPAMQALASTYQREDPDVIITVVQRAVTLGYPLLLEGVVDIAVLTWLPDAKSESLWMQPLAYDGLAVIVHPQNGIPGLTQTQVQKLYQGQVQNWADWSGLPGVPQLISRETASGEFLYMQNRVMRDVRTSLNATLAPDSSYMLKLVGEDPLAVGYISTALVTPRVRAVAIDGVPPGKETIKAQIYPLSRTIIVVTEGQPVEPARGFVQWMLSNEGQAVLQRHRFISVLD